jgi:hypothetical protein
MVKTTGLMNIHLMKEKTSMFSGKVSQKQNKYRKYSGSGPRPDLRKARQQEAVERQVFWDSLLPHQKLEALDRRLGKGVGASKQRKRLIQENDTVKSRPLRIAIP